MAVDARHLEGSERHQAGKPASLAADGIDPLVKAVQDAHKFEIDTKRLNYTMGTGFEETHKAGLLLANYSKMGGGAANSAKEKAERRAYQEAVLHALQSGDIGNFMANEIFGNMSEAEINDLVAEIEAETGMPFEDYAADILGEDAAAKLDGETLAEYRQRMLIALGSEMLDENGIKPEYKDDPLAQFILNDRRYQELMEDIAPLKKLDAHEKASETEIGLAKEKSTDFNAADHIGNQVENIEVKDTATTLQDGHTDGRADAPTTQAVNEGGFGALSLEVGGLFTPDSKLDGKTITEDFNVANAGPSPELEPVAAVKAEISFEA